MTRWQQRNQGIALALLPVAGLGNKLFVWAKAAVFAHRNSLPLAVVGWSWPRPRALLRRNGGKRQYRRYFVQRDFEAARALASIAMMRPTISEPAACEVERVGNAVYLFNKIPHWSDYFGGIRAQRELVRSLLYAELAPATKAALDSSPRPCVAVHIRCGDFRELAPQEDFAKVGNVRTPLAYFAALIGQIREQRKENLPVTLFSDGTDTELTPLLALPNVTRSNSDNDVLDLLLMSEARLIVAAAGSTFSQWSGFLADAPLIMHPSHIHQPIRPGEVNERFYEGPVRGSYCDWPPLLRANVDQIGAG